MEMIRFGPEPARAAAQRLVDYYEPLVNRLMVVGSIRRNRCYVHDVDIVIEPKGREKPSGDLFSKPTIVYQAPPPPKWVTISKRGANLIHGFAPVPSEYTDAGVPGLIPFDIYIADPIGYVFICFIRTGSKENNIRLAKRAKTMRGKLHASGLGITIKGKLHRIETEEDVYRILELDYQCPEDR